MAGIAVTRLDLSASELRLASSGSKNAAAARRMLALALVMEGADRTSAARSCGMDRQTLRDWVHRYNADGLSGLENKPLPGRSSKLTAEHKQGLIALVEAGLQAGKDKVVRWRRADLRDRLAQDFGLVLHERTVGKLLNALGYRRLSVRPFNPKADLAAQDVFKKTSQPM
jgi:transposase